MAKTQRLRRNWIEESFRASFIWFNLLLGAVGFCAGFGVASLADLPESASADVGLGIAALCLIPYATFAILQPPIGMWWRAVSFVTTYQRNQTDRRSPLDLDGVGAESYLRNDIHDVSASFIEQEAPDLRSRFDEIWTSLQDIPLEALLSHRREDARRVLRAVRQTEGAPSTAVDLELLSVIRILVDELCQSSEREGGHIPFHRSLLRYAWLSWRSGIRSRNLGQLKPGHFGH